MQKIHLTGTDLEVTRLCLGTANFGTRLTEPEACAMLDAYAALGGNFVDSAMVYCDWVPGEKHRSETWIGRWLRRRGDRETVVVTKGCHYDFDRPEICRVRPELARQDVAGSLERLGRIDAWLYHRDDPEVPVGELIGVMEEEVAAGHIRWYGCSNWSAERVSEAAVWAKANRCKGFVLNEVMGSMAMPDPAQIPADYAVLDGPMRDACAKLGLNVLCFGSIANGYLTKRYRGETLPDDVAARYDTPENEAVFAEVSGLQDAAAVTRASLEWFGRFPFPAVPIAAFSTPAQLREAAAAFAE